MTNKYYKHACVDKQESRQKNGTLFERSNRNKSVSPYKKLMDSFWEKVESQDLTSKHLAICFAMVSYLKYDSNIAVCSLKELQSRSRISKNTLLKCLLELEQKGVIQKLTHQGYKNSYILSYAYVGLEENQKNPNDVREDQIKNEHDPDISFHQKPNQTVGGSKQNQGVAQKRTTPYIYINKRTKKRKTTSLQKKEDDVFFGNENVQKNPPSQKIVYDPEKLRLCKRYVANLKALNLVEIKTTEAQYLASIYRNNEEVDTWENLKEKTKSMETQLTEKKNPVYFVEVPKNQEDLKHDLKHTNEIDIDTLKKRESYEDEYQAILKEFQEDNPMIKPMIKPGAFVDRLVHAKMHENLLVGEGRS
jgi:DNA-binding MarR family transcriptional regulator